MNRRQKKNTTRKIDSGDSGNNNQDESISNKRRQKQKQSSSKRNSKKNKVTVEETIARTLLGLPTPILIQIINNLDNVSMINTLLSSKRFPRIIRMYPDEIINRISPTIEVIPTYGSARTLIDNLLRNLPDRVRQNFVHLKLNNVHEFYNDLSEEQKELMFRGNYYSSNQIGRINSLEISSTYNAKADNKNIFFSRMISTILPNLRAITIDGKTTRGSDSVKILHEFNLNCRKLDSITWNNISKASNFELDGTNICTSKTLRELYLDDSIFIHYGGKTVEAKQMDLLEWPYFYMFRHLNSKVLERMSIRNMKYCRGRSRSPKPIPQNMLIKFVRNTPKTLRWFRSDLTQHNMNLLKKERPEITFLN